jgi:two-component system sensor histidine kinase DegS
MSESSSSFEKFVTRALVILETTGRGLEELAQIAFLTQQQVVASQENGHDASDLQLQQFSRQVIDLAERSQQLYDALKNGLDGLPVDDEHWSQVRILQSQEEERMQIARTLEDSVGQLLANTIFELASCRSLLGEDEQACAGGLDGVQSELEQGLSDFRHFITELDPTTVLSNFGLGGGIRRYLEQYEAKTGLKTRLWINTNFGRLPTMIEIAIFRIIQEALTNVHRHANASQVVVTFEEQDSRLVFSVTDDGEGVISEKVGQSRRSLGLARMIDYAELMNGKLRILSEPGQGTRVILSIPYPAL